MPKSNEPIEPWRLLESTYPYRDRWLTLRSDSVRLPNGNLLSPYHVIEVADWVNVVAITDRGCMLLVEQYRAAIESKTIEMPAGLVGDLADSADEHAVEAARRELLEETGYEAGRIAFFMAGPSSSGMSNEIMAFVRAYDLRRVHAAFVAWFERGTEEVELFVPWAKQAVVHAIHESGRVVSEVHEDEGTRFVLRATSDAVARIRKRLDEVR